MILGEVQNLTASRQRTTEYRPRGQAPRPSPLAAVHGAAEVQPSTDDLGSLRYASIEHNGVCLGCRAVAHKIIAAEAETTERVAVVLANLGLADEDQR